MKRRIFYSFPNLPVNAPSIFLALFWILGFLFGAYAANYLPEDYVSMIQASAGKQAAFWGLFLTGCLPFLAAYFCVCFSKNYLLYPVGFLKAFFFSLCSMCIYRGFGSAGWLVNGLFQWADRLLLPVLYWYCLRHLTGTSSKRDAFLCLAFYVSFLYLEYRFVSPYLAMLIEI